jgi:glycosyltransferase 2 family protein
MRRKFRRLLVAPLVIAALVALAYNSRHRIHLGDFTWRTFSRTVSQANIWLLVLALAGIYVAYGLRAVRWKQLSKYCGPSTLGAMFSGTMMGFAAIFVLGRPGEPIRPLLLARKNHMPVSSMFGIWVLERLFDFAATVVMACLSLLVFSQSLSDAGANTDWVNHARAGGWALLGVLLLVVALMTYFWLHGAEALERRLQSWRQPRSWRGRAATIITGFSDGLQAIRTVSDLFAALGYTALLWALEVLVYLWIAQAFSGNFEHSVMNFPGAMLLIAVTLVGATLQLPGIGGGAQVASFIALTTIFGVEQEPAAAIAVVLWLITFAASALVGVPLLVHEGLSMGELRKLAEAEDQAEESGEHLPMVGVNQSSSTRQAPRHDSGEASR